MAMRSLRWLLLVVLVCVFAGCSVDKNVERFGRLYDAVQSKPDIRPPPDYEPAATTVVSADPFEKADVVVFATRPGDATAWTYATIQQAVAQGLRVVVIYVTNGDAQSAVARALADLPATATPTPRQYLHGAAVLQEVALDVAVGRLGLTLADVIFLSYPDGVLQATLEEPPEYVVRSPYTERDRVHDPNVTPYRILRSGEEFPYTFNSALRDLNDVLIELNPQVIYLPAPDSIDETEAAAARLITRSLREVAPPDARVFVYMQASSDSVAPDRRIAVTDPTAKQVSLDLYTLRIGIAVWPELPAALLEEELFWEFDYSR